MFRSLNGGSSWSAVNTGLPDYANVLALAIDPTTPTTLYAGTYGGVFRSLNGGSSWQATGLTNTDVHALAINPTTPTTLYAGTWDRGVLRSLNGGSSWQATGLGTEPICGDGLVRCGEECDDGGESATCDADCTLPQCGDGTLNVTAGEQCDDGNRNPFDGCTNDCTVCGDGIVTPPEECDDGNTSSGDGCDAQCRRPRVVGTGTPQSCTEAAFAAALAATVGELQLRARSGHHHLDEREGDHRRHNHRRRGPDHAERWWGSANLHGRRGCRTRRAEPDDC